jgi:(R,R)-butanediol dehydrogenase / meso-butanediol dehydrogenase / diacetyl reductase
MRSARCTGPRAFSLREVPTPVPKAGEVIVQVHNCGICGSDLHWYCGDFPAPGVCPGHEIAGEIADVGPEVGGWAPGDQVAVEPLVVCRECSYCRVGNYQLCPRFQLLGLTLDGGFADRVAVPAYALYRLPEALDCEIGALTEPMAVCVHAVRLSGLALGQRVLILGAGTIGLLSLLCARSAGAAEIAITARHSHQAAMARQMGAAQVFAATSAGDRERAEWAASHPIDVVIETVGGTADTLADAITSVRAGGTVAVLGVFTGATFCPALALVAKEVRLVGSLTYGRSGARSDFDTALDVLAAHRDAARSLITHRFDLADIRKAFAAAADKKRGAIKVTVTT